MGSLLEISAVAAGICSWVAWIAIGLVAGFLADRVFGGRRLLLLDITVGLGGAIAGGWGTACALGERTSQAFLLTILVAVFGSVDHQVLSILEMQCCLLEQRSAQHILRSTRSHRIESKG